MKRPRTPFRASADLRLAVLVPVALGGGAFTALAFAPARVFPAALLGPAASLWAAARARTLERGAACGLAYGLGFTAVAFRWTLELHPAAYLALPTLEAVFWVIPGAVAARAFALRPGWWVASVTATWTLVEALRARFPLGGFEWGQLGLTTADLPLRRGAAVFGVLGVTAFVVALAAGLAALILWRAPRPWAALLVGAACLAAVTALGLVPWTTPAGALDVAVVQVDDPCPGRFAVDCPDLGNRLREAFVAQTSALQGNPDLILWGEGALGGGAPPAVGDALVERAGTLRAPLLAGTTSAAGPGRYWNRNVLYAPDGDVIDAYAKRYAVPFGEYVPLRGLLGGVAGVGRLVPSDMVAGTSSAPLAIPTGEGDVAVGTVVSWEVTFARLVRDVGRGAEAIATLTTQATYGTSSVSDQLLAAAQLRAAELGRGMVVAATTGRSALILPTGERAAATALFRADRLTGTLPLRRGLTPFARFGEAPIILMAVAALALSVWHTRRRPPAAAPSAAGQMASAEAGRYARQRPS